MFPANSELISRANGYAIGEIDFQQLFALDRLAGFVRKSGDDVFGAGVDYIPRGRKGETPIDAKGNPAGLIAQLDTHFLLWRHDGGVEDVNAAVGAVIQPQFLFVGSKSDAVAGTAMPLGGTFLKARYFDPVQHFPGLDVSHFKTEQIVDVDESKGLAAV